MTHFKAMVTRGSFLAPSSAHSRPFLRLINTPSALATMTPRPSLVEKRFARPLRANSVLVSRGLLATHGESHSHALKNVWSVSSIPMVGETGARALTRSMSGKRLSSGQRRTSCSRALGSNVPDLAADGEESSVYTSFKAFSSSAVNAAEGYI